MIFEAIKYIHTCWTTSNSHIIQIQKNQMRKIGLQILDIPPKPEPDPNRMNEFGCFSVSFSIIKIILMKVEQIKYASIELLVFNKIIFSFQNLLLNSLKLGSGIELLSVLAAPTAEADFNLIRRFAEFVIVVCTSQSTPPSIRLAC